MRFTIADVATIKIDTLNGSIKIPMEKAKERTVSNEKKETKRTGDSADRAGVSQTLKSV